MLFSHLAAVPHGAALASPHLTGAAGAGAPSGVETIATPTIWAFTLLGVAALLALDFLITRRPHDVTLKEAIGWSAFYIAVPLAFGAWVWWYAGAGIGVDYYTGYLVEKTLSVDNLFVFMLLLSAFAVPRVLQQRVLLIGIIGALLMRAVFIAVGAQLIARFDWTFLLFGAILLVTAVKVLRDTIHGGHEVAPDEMRVTRLVRRLYPVTSDYRGTSMSVVEGGRRHLTPLALVAVAILSTDLVFAIDSIPAVYGITGDPYLVFATNAFALLGLRALYFVLEGAVGRLVHLGYGLAVILGFIGVKLVLHWAHGIWEWVPLVPTLASLGVIVGVLALVTATSLIATRGGEASGRATVHDDPGGDEERRPEASFIP